MKLVNTLYNLEFDLMENQILVLSIENHLAYRNILEELWKQYKGETGNFILSDGDKELKMSQRIECIYNIFNINTNDRKIISKLYQELTYQNDTLLQEESIRFKQELMYLATRSQLSKATRATQSVPERSRSMANTSEATACLIMQAKQHQRATQKNRQH